jgi:regulator of sigma E protease
VLQEKPVQVLQVTADMPAAQAGLQPNDQIATIDGVPLHSVGAIIAYLQDQDGKPAALNVLRNGQHVMLLITPKSADSGAGTQTYQLGFRAMPSPTDVQKLSVGAALKDSAAQNLHDSKLILQVLHHLFGGKVSVKSLSGPIGIGQTIGLAVKMGWWEVPHVMAQISLNLGIFNLLPFPILDGGMILFLLIETVIRRDVNQVWKERIYQAAFVVIILFAAFVIFNDISKLTPFAKLKP